MQLCNDDPKWKSIQWVGGGDEGRRRRGQFVQFLSSHGVQITGVKRAPLKLMWHFLSLGGYSKPYRIANNIYTMHCVF